MTVHGSASAYLFQAAASVLLLRAAWTDLREYKIGNKLVLALGGLFVAYALIAGQWSDLRWDLVFAAIMFLAFLVVYALGWMGGGDVKLLAVAFLWVGLSGAQTFSILLAISSGAHAIAARLGWVKSQLTDTGRRRMPYGPAIACAVIGTFCLQTLQGA